MGAKPLVKTTFFEPERTKDLLPLPPPSYPTNLQGMMWLDTFGAFGTTDLPDGGFEDGVISFGDADFATLNAETGEILVSTSGPAWMWLNNAQAYQEYNTVARYGNYLFKWNSDYTEARIWMSSHKDGRNWFGLGPDIWSFPLLFVQYYIQRRPPAPSGACPPAANATKEERTRCATWDRISCLLGCFGSWFGVNKAVHYYAYEVVDRHGQAIEPYYRAMVDFVKSRSAPNASAALSNNVTLGTEGLKNGTVFHGTYLGAP